MNRRVVIGLACGWAFALLAAQVPAQAQTLHVINQCKTPSLASNSLTEQSAKRLETGQTVQVPTPYGPVTYKVRSGDTVWSLCAMTLRAAPAFGRIITATKTQADTEKQTIASLNEQIVRLKHQQAAEPTTTSTKVPIVTTPAPGRPPSPPMDWVPWIVAAIASLIALVLLMIVITLSRRSKDRAS